MWKHQSLCRYSMPSFFASYLWSHFPNSIYSLYHRLETPQSCRVYPSEWVNMIYWDEKKDLYRNKKRCVETYQIQSNRLSDGAPPAVAKVIVLRFISKKRGQNKKVEMKASRESTILFINLIIIQSGVAYTVLICM